MRVRGVRDDPAGTALGGGGHDPAARTLPVGGSETLTREEIVRLACTAAFTHDLVARAGGHRRPAEHFGAVAVG
jgi:hypothetical protein